MQHTSPILITGSTGMVGRAVVNLLRKQGYSNLLTPTRQTFDLRSQQDTMHYLMQNRPEYLFHLAAMVGGIHANNTYPAQFIYDNTIMHSHIIHSAWRAGVKKLLFPGSACTYPKMAPQPVREASFLDGPIEPTNLAYAAAKINGIVMCQSYRKQYGFNTIIPMPTNAYGIGDNFNPDASHVIPALMKRFHEAKTRNLSSVVIWGTGKILREFINVEDLADALIFLMHRYDEENIINVGTGEEITILELAHTLANVTGYTGTILTDPSKPDGAPRKCLDSSRLKALGWKPKIRLEEGLTKMYGEYHSSAQ